MNIFKTGAMVVVVTIALCAAAAAPVAVRVEIETLELDAEGTQVVLTVQISPEDRSRIGRNAMVRVTLDGDVPPGQSPLWAVRIENDGSGQIDTVWPPGEHSLRVEISSPSGEHTGLWVGTVRIPGAGMAARDANVETPAPEKTAAPEAEIDPSAAAAGSAIAGGSAVPPVVEEPVEISETVEEVVTEQPARNVDESPEVEQRLEQLPEPEIVMEADAAPDIDVPLEPAPIEVSVENEVEAPAPDRGDDAPAVVAGAAGTAAATVPENSAEMPSKPETESVAAPPSAPDEADLVPDVAVVEPLRGESARPKAEPDAAADPASEASEADPDPPTADVATALKAWADADPATADLTVIAFRDNEPATGLTPSDFSLRVGGEDAMIEEIGGRDRAPLQLGIAVDVATGSGRGWSQSGSRLFSLLQRARAGRGHVFFAADGRVGPWDGGPGDSRGGTGASGSGDLTSLIVDSLEQFKGRRGRTFLVVVTDGRVDTDKTAWKRAMDVAENSGVPVLVIALWDDDFSHRVRKNLKTIANVSGGSLFLVQGSDQLDRAAERFGPMIDAGVAIRFIVPPGVVLPAPVSVNADDKALDVTAPKGVR